MIEKFKNINRRTIYTGIAVALFALAETFGFIYSYNHSQEQRRQFEVNCLSTGGIVQTGKDYTVIAPFSGAPVVINPIECVSVKNTQDY